MRPIATSYNTQSGGSTRNQMTCGKLPGLLSYGEELLDEEKLWDLIKTRSWLWLKSKSKVSGLYTMGSRGVIADKWSMRILWACAIGSAVSLYMVAVERQAQNRQRMLAEELKAMESGESNGKDG
ncbi:hypothetical protein GmHk_12G035024 [Glycine max]|nr:hypothetical protein GmHk_12G035024 [Glycine max]